MIYILIIVAALDGAVHTGHIEFNSRAACQEAGEAIMDAKPGWASRCVKMGYACVAKGYRS